MTSWSTRYPRQQRRFGETYAAVETSIEVWREVMEVNLNAAFVCSCEAVGPMTAIGSGSIINIASIMRLSGGGIYPIASYHASKGGRINLTRGLAVEWAIHGIRFNAIAPTWVRTELTKPLLDNPVGQAVGAYAVAEIRGSNRCRGRNTLSSVPCFPYCDWPHTRSRRRLFDPLTTRGLAIPLSLDAPTTAASRQGRRPPIDRNS
jgi:NAD(P)-dependent dehydrogenase (short-subunit alcohol dehydrogenase family)